MTAPVLRGRKIELGESAHGVTQVLVDGRVVGWAEALNVHVDLPPSADAGAYDRVVAEVRRLVNAAATLAHARF